MSWEFWSDFLNSKGDYYPIQSDAEKYEQENPEEAKLIEKIMDNPELAEKMKKLEE